MGRRSAYQACLLVLIFLSASLASAADTIPKAAWSRGIGEPLANPGTKKPDIESIDDGYWQGAPVGGFGAGTFSRTYRGDFSRWHLKAGVHKYQTVYANQFAMFQQVEGSPQSVAQVLSADHPKDNQLRSWKWDYPVGAGNYYALYPKSWYDYRWDQFPAHVMLEQFSPILPGNYRETSYPIAVYLWHAENPTDKAVTVSILFSWTNMLGWPRTFSHDFANQTSEGDFNHFVSTPQPVGKMKGIVFDRNRLGSIQNEWDGQMAIATLEAPGVEVTYQTTYQPDGDGAAVWTPFSKDGKLSNSGRRWTSSGETLAGAITVRFTLQPGEKRVVPMVIAWDLPVVQFGAGRKWYRHYTDFYGTSGSNAWKIAADGLNNAAHWSDAVDNWQAPYVNDESKPLWYRGMLFNEMYILADGGSFWGRPVGSDANTPATFGFMECFDYPYYSTLDVLFYGSLPLVKFWPDLDKQVLRQFADAVPRELNDKYIWTWKSQQTGQPELRIRKARGAVPHDLGVPAEDPFVAINQFSWQDTSGWKDLNPKMVLMIYRDYVFTGHKDVQFLRYTWPSIQQALRYLEQFDHNGDGLPESNGYPDQTYDEWVVQGESAYSASLYLAALRAAEEIAKTLGDSATSARYHDLFAKGQVRCIKKLWNGDYFLYDTASEYKDNIQAEQLAGQWYASMTGLGNLVPSEMQQKVLRKVFDFNVMKFGNGEMGAVSGMAADGNLIRKKDNEQVQEVWTGATFSVAALMLSNGMKDEAYHTAWGVYHVVYETKGYWFRTPEAYDSTGNFRASMYMRPAGIWAMEMRPPGKP